METFRTAHGRAINFYTTVLSITKWKKSRYDKFFANFNQVFRGEHFLLESVPHGMVPRISVICRNFVMRDMIQLLK